MSTVESGRDHSIGVLSEAPLPSQLAQPLDYIFAEHFRQRVLCNALDDIADAKATDRQLVEAAARYLVEDFPPHILDEERELFPLLRRRAKPDDNVTELIGQLSEEHTADKIDAHQIIAGLRTLLNQPGKMPAGFANLLHRFAANERHHLTLENAIMLPLARLRLTQDDLATLSHRMAQRRGLPWPEVSDAD